MSIRKFKINSIGQYVKYPVDVFMCCGSYEYRCRTIPDALQKEEVRQAIVIENKNLSAIVSQNSDYLRNSFGERAIDVETNSANSIITADNIKKTLEGYFSGTPKRYLIDITTFRHESLLILLSVIKLLRREGDRVELIYCSASEYGIGCEMEDKWLTKGVAEVRTVLGFGGDILPARQMHLMILVGFEYQRASKLIEILEPSSISLGYGTDSSATDETHVPSQRYFFDVLRHMTTMRQNVELFPFSCNDPDETKKAIVSQMRNFPDHNFVLAPMNTKLSTVGCALAAFDHPEVQICYAQPIHYNFDGYSSPGENCYLFEFV
jgi:hypothetical protein